MSSNLSPSLSPLFSPSPAAASRRFTAGRTAPRQHQLDEVEVQNIPERPGQMLRMSLETQMHAAGAPTTELYTLSVTYSIAARLGMREDTSTTRNRFTAIATWTLAPIGNPAQALASGSATAKDAENIIDQQYFAVTLEADTVNQQLADEVAAQITAQVAAWFRAHPNA